MLHVISLTELMRLHQGGANRQTDDRRDNQTATLIDRQAFEAIYIELRFGLAIQYRNLCYVSLLLDYVSICC